MNFRISYIIPLLVLSAKMFCQDFLIKKDSVRIEVKLLEVKPDELKYKLFSYQDGPDIIISKNEVAYVIYSNGIKEVFKSTENTAADNIFVNPTPLKGSVKRPDSIGNYIKFNLQLGTMMQSLSSNYQRREPSPQNTASEKYSASSNKYIYNYNVGFNFLFGSSPYIKHIIGVNYLRSTGEYDYSSGSLGSGDGYGGWTTHSEDFHYVSKIDFINLVTGLRFKLFKKLYIEPLVSINIIAQSDVRCSGTALTNYHSGGPTPYIYKVDIKEYSNEKVNSERDNINSTVSLCPKISYDFHVKKQILGVYISYNLAYKFKLPWMMMGITYYPFKKLR